MSDAKTDDRLVLETRLSKFMNPVFRGETWVIDHYQKPTLTPLKNAYQNFLANPSQTHFELFQTALIACESAENTKISAKNLPNIIQIAGEILESFPLKENTKNSPR